MHSTLSVFHTGRESRIALIVGLCAQSADTLFDSLIYKEFSIKRIIVVCSEQLTSICLKIHYLLDESASRLVSSLKSDSFVHYFNRL